MLQLLLMPVCISAGWFTAIKWTRGQSKKWISGWVSLSWMFICFQKCCLCCLFSLPLFVCVSPQKPAVSTVRVSASYQLQRWQRGIQSSHEHDTKRGREGGLGHSGNRGVKLVLLHVSAFSSFLASTKKRKKEKKQTKNPKPHSYKQAASSIIFV